MYFSEKCFKDGENMGKTKFSLYINHLFHLHFIHLVRCGKEIGLSKGQPPILMSLMNKNFQTQSELCECVHIRPASMTDVLQRMEKNGLVNRVRDEKDMRIVRVGITQNGTYRLKEFMKKEDSFEEICFRGFTEDEKEHCVNSIIKMIENMEKETGDEI